jgi:outer membrane receptor protein involved in Fe transport
MSAKQSEYVSYPVRCAVGLVAILVLAPWAAAADPADTGPAPSTSNASSPAILEEVTITGTRIKRRDLESISPLVSVDSEQLEQRAGLNLESYLNQLPNYNPAQVPTTENEDVQPSAVNTVGISTISLRGFGPNRSLVLIDGHRTTPVNALMVTDINSIPAAMIDRVEIITGGASAVYGADAIGGVTNFIMKKNFQGAQFDVQDGITQAGDGNELRASALMGTRFSEGKGNMVLGLEYYDRNVAYQRNRDFYTDAWKDPNAPQSQANAFFVQGYSGYSAGFAGGPSTAAFNALWPNRAATPGGGVCSFGGCNPFNTIYFNNNGTLWTNQGPNSSSNYAGPIGSNGYALANALDGLVPNAATAPAPDVIQNLKWNNPLATISEPQTRYSFFANGTYDITDKIQFYTTARFAESLTTTLLDTPTTGTYGWEAEVPFNAGTDSPILPSAVNSSTSAATLSAIAAAFASNPTNNPYVNPGFITPGTKGAGHPVPWQLAMLLLSRGATNGVPASAPGGVGVGGPIPCNPYISPSVSINCGAGYPGAPTSWILDYLPQNGAPQRSTVDQSQTFQIETGFRFPLFSDWTGDLYYSRGQSANYENAYGNDSLQRFRAVIDSPGYGAGASFIGNANGADLNFGTSVPTTCTSGFYNALFANGGTSPDCAAAVGAPLQTYTAMQQDIVEANFNGTVARIPTGDVSGALGFQYRRDAGQFIPDNLQSTYSFLDQTIGLYPLGSLNNEISTRDGYAELFIPVVSKLGLLDKLDLDVGGRYSAFSNNIPKSTTFKINMDAGITRSLRIRGGFNRANRAPNLGELYLGEQEYFGAGAQFGDPCSVRSTAPFGAAGAAPDFSGSGSSAGTPTKLAGGQTAAGALSTYLICQAQMGGAAPTAANPTGSGAAGAYYSGASGPLFSQGALANAAAFAWLNEEGDPNLRSETANTWTAGFVVSNLGDNPLISGLSGSVDWWQVEIHNAIELDSPDYANYLCYGSVTVTNAAQAAAQAASAACQNIPRNPSTGGELTSLLTYANQATIATAGIDLQLNWFVQLADLGIKLPGAFTFTSQDSFLQYYKTKQSPANFDETINWKDSVGPNLAGTNGGAYGYRLFTTIGYSLPAFTVNLRWRFLPSVNSYQHAEIQSIIDHNNQVAAAGGTNFLSYIPNTDIATPAWSQYDLSALWNINKTFQLRGGINNVFNKEPPISANLIQQAAQKGYPPGTNLNAVCSATAAQRGCENPSTYSLPSDGAGVTNAGFYDVYGRTFFLGFRASF